MNSSDGPAWRRNPWLRLINRLLVWNEATAKRWSLSTLGHRLRFLLLGKYFPGLRLGRHFVCIGAVSLRLGRDVEIGDFVRLQSEDIRIGHHSYIGHSNFIFGRVEIGDHFMSGPHVSLMGGNHGFERLDCPMIHQPCTVKGIRIGNDVWVGANTVVLDGVCIGDHCIIGGGSVVTRDCLSRGIYAGNPARLIRLRE